MTSSEPLQDDDMMDLMDALGDPQMPPGPNQGRETVHSSEDINATSGEDDDATLEALAGPPSEMQGQTEEGDGKHEDRADGDDANEAPKVSDSEVIEIATTADTNKNSERLVDEDKESNDDETAPIETSDSTESPLNSQEQEELSIMIFQCKVLNECARRSSMRKDRLLLCHALEPTTPQTTRGLVKAPPESPRSVMDFDFQVDEEAHPSTKPGEPLSFVLDSWLKAWVDAWMPVVLEDPALKEIGVCDGQQLLRRVEYLPLHQQVMAELSSWDTRNKFAPRLLEFLPKAVVARDSRIRSHRRLLFRLSYEIAARQKTYQLRLRKGNIKPGSETKQDKQHQLNVKEYRERVTMAIKNEGHCIKSMIRSELKHDQLLASRHSNPVATSIKVGQAGKSVDSEDGTVDKTLRTPQ